MDLSPLDRFCGKLANLSSDNLINEVHKNLYIRFSESIGSVYPSATVSSKGKKYRRTITVSKDGLWFEEYGTGYMGNGTFPDPQKLPTETITFDSEISSGQTEGWVYNYNWENYWSNHRDVKDGYVYEPAWWWGTHWNYGQIAKAGVWKATNDLRIHMLDIAKYTVWGMMQNDNV